MSIAMVLLFLVATLALFVPNFAIWHYGKKYLPVFHNPYLTLTIKSGLFAIAFSPTVYGHAGVVPAIWLLLFASDYGRIYGLIPILSVWSICFVYLAISLHKKTEIL